MTPDLLYRLNAKDEVAFKEVFHLYYKPLCGYLYNHRCLDEDAKASMVADVFLCLWRGIQKGDYIKDYQHLKCILFFSIKRKLRSYRLLQRGPKQKLFCYVDDTEKYDTEDEPCAVDGALSDPLTRIKAVIETLPQQCKVIFNMWAFDKMDYKEIAVALDISPQTARNQKTRAIQLLKQKLKV